MIYSETVTNLCGASPLLAAAPSFDTKDLPTVIIAVGFLVFVVVYAIHKLRPQTQNGGYDKDDRKAVHDTRRRVLKLNEQHDQTDSDGIPRWYFPSSYAKNQEKTIKTLEAMAHDQRRAADSMEIIAKRSSE